MNEPTRTLVLALALAVLAWLVVDESADRVGLLLSANLEEVASTIGVADDSKRVERLLPFAVSSTYVALREQLGLAIVVGD